MADRSVALTTIKGGINRQRTKGGALEDSLYDLVNGYVSKSRTVIVRPGTVRFYELPTNTAGESETHGLMAFEGSLHVFATREVDVPPGVILHIITHPDSTSENPIEIAVIDFAAPFMGFPYVVATFDNGDTWHFWLQDGDEWEADTMYRAGDVVSPSVANGLAFQAFRLGDPNPSWAPNVSRALGDIIEPTVYNDFYYTVVQTEGDNPRSGTVEPVWPTEDGAQVIEDADGTDTTPPALTQPPDSSAIPPSSVLDRYLRNRLGS